MNESRTALPSRHCIVRFDIGRPSEAAGLVIGQPRCNGRFVRKAIDNHRPSVGGEFWGYFVTHLKAYDSKGSVG